MSKIVICVELVNVFDLGLYLTHQKLNPAPHQLPERHAKRCITLGHQMLLVVAEEAHYLGLLLLQIHRYSQDKRAGTDQLNQRHIGRY